MKRGESHERRGRPRTGRKYRGKFAERLLRTREDRGLTQKEAADALGATVNSWSKWETGKEPRGMIRQVLEHWISGRYRPELWDRLED